MTENTSKVRIIDLLLEHAEQHLLLDSLVTLIQEHNPRRYEYHFGPDRHIAEALNPNTFQIGESG